MKPKSNRLFPSAIIVAAATAATTAMSHAANGTWTNAASGNWTTGPWTGGVPNTASDIATFNQNWNGHVITVDTAFTVGQILATDTTANGGLTISGGTLTLANGGSSPIISTGTNNAFGETAANRFKISSVLDGTNGFERQGNGYLDLSGVTNLFSGTIKLTAPSATAASFTVINSDANLGNSTNAITVALNSQPVGFYNDASAGNFTLNSARTITTSGSGQLWVKNKLGANMTIAGVISGTALLRKNDSGTLTLTNGNTYNGGTWVEGGTLVLSGGNNRLLSGSTVTMGTGTAGATLEINGGNQTINGLVLTTPTAATSNVIRGNGTLILQGTGDYSINTGYTSTSLNMADLAGFTFTRASNNFTILASANATLGNVTNTVNLAKTGTNTISANNVFIGQGGNSTSNQQLSVLGLGQTNIFNVGTELAISNFTGSGRMAFQAGLSGATLTLRGAAGGSSALPNFRIGRVSSGNGNAQTGTLDLTGGSIDAIVTGMSVGYQIAGATTAATGNFTMPAGTIVADVLSVAHKNNSTNNPTVTGTINQSGGNITATTVNLGHNESAVAVPNLIANYNLTGGTLFATTIQGSGSSYGNTTVRNLTIDGGTLSNLAGGNLTVNGLATTATGRINVIAGASGATFNADATRTITLGANTVLSGGAITKSGAGILALNGNNTYTGTTTVNGGILSISSDNNLGAVPGSPTPGSIVLNGGTLRTTAAFTLNSNRGITLDASGGTINNAADGTTTYDGKISGIGDLTVTHAGSSGGDFSIGTFTQANSYSGATIISNGHLSVNNLVNGLLDSSIGSSSNVAANLVLQNGATLHYAGNATAASTDRLFTLGAGDNELRSSGTGGITFDNVGNVAFTSSGNRTLSLRAVTANTTNTLASVIGDNAPGQLTQLHKHGVGTWSLTGNSTYTGETIINAGTLAINASISTSLVTVKSGGTLGGNGSIAGAVSVQSGGTLAAGNSIESLGVASVEFLAGSTFAYELNSAALNGDLAYSTGTLNITNGLGPAGTTLTLTELSSGTLAMDSKLTLISYTGGWFGELFDYGGTLLADDSTFTLGANMWKFDYNDTSGGSNFSGDQFGAGSFVTMTVIPEPNVAALLGGLGTLALLRRRR